MHPLITTRNLLIQQEARLVELFTLALLHLRKHGNIAVIRDENNLNRKLFFSLREANRELYSRGRGFDHLPLCECNNQPDADDEKRASREDKRPDFLWELVDHHQPDPRRSSLLFAIECKRLGLPTSVSWVLNDNYVGHGIIRFNREEHGYGRSTPFGIMVGYIESSDPAIILSEVNSAANRMLIPDLELTPSGQVQDSLMLLGHSFARPYPDSPFKLRHLWIDLR